MAALRYGEIRLKDELQFSVYNFEHADVVKAGNTCLYESEARRSGRYNALTGEKQKVRRRSLRRKRKAKSEQRNRFRC
jgi:hypothetical protein